MSAVYGNGYRNLNGEIIHVLPDGNAFVKVCLKSNYSWDYVFARYYLRNRRNSEDKVKLEDLKVGAKVKVDISFNSERKLWHANRMSLQPGHPYVPEVKPEKSQPRDERFYAKMAVVRMGENIDPKLEFQDASSSVISVNLADSLKFTIGSNPVPESTFLVFVCDGQQVRIDVQLKDNKWTIERVNLDFDLIPAQADTSQDSKMEQKDLASSDDAKGPSMFQSGQE